MTFEERTAVLDQYLACLDLQPSLEACTSEVSYETIGPRIQAISNMVAHSDISDRSKQFLKIFSQQLLLYREKESFAGFS